MNLFFRVWSIFWNALKLDTSLRYQFFKYYSLTVLTILIGVGVSVGINSWREKFMQSIRDLNYVNFGWLILIFTGIAFIGVFTYAFQTYYQKKAEFSIRESLYNFLIIDIHESPAILKAQRLQEDTRYFSELVVFISTSLLDALLKLLSFSIVIFTVAPIWVILFILIYTIIGTYLSKRVSKPLVDLDYTQEQIEGKFRTNLAYAIDNKETLPPLDIIKLNWIQLATKLKQLALFQSSYNQLTNIIPFVVLSPLYFKTKTLDIGGLWKIADAMGVVLDSLAIVINRRENLTKLEAVTKRLEELNQ
jgi:putative ATP-binding cassette transporter